MSKIFDMNNPVWQFIGKLVDATVLHICWLVCSLPIVTIGASTTALYYAMMKDVADEETHYVRAFFRSFKQNLKQGIFMGLIFLATGALIAYAIYFYGNMEGTFWAIVRGVAIMCAILWVFIVQYVFALLARFDNKIGKLIFSAFIMSIRHIGWTILMIFILAAMLFIAFGVNFLPILILGFGLVVYLDSYILNHILKDYIRAAQGPAADKDPDEWVIPEDGEGEGTEATAEGTEIPEIAENGEAAETADAPESEAAEPAEAPESEPAETADAPESEPAETAEAPEKSE